MNVRWERHADADHQAAESRTDGVAALRAGERRSGHVPSVERRGAAGTEGGPVVEQLVEATRRLVVALTDLCDRPSEQLHAQTESRERAVRFAGQLHGMVGAVRAALSRAPEDRRGALRSPRRANPSLSEGHPLKLLSGRLASGAGDETSGVGTPAPALKAFVLGPFRALLNGQAIQDWPNCRAKAIFKFLLLNRKQPVAREALMERFWPEAEPEAARNNLNVAMHRLRRALGRDGFPFVLFSGGHYLLNPKLAVSTDADAFLAHAARASELERDGDPDGAIREYSACVGLYQGELLAEDRYEHDEWLIPLRQLLRDRYLHALDRLGTLHFGRQDVPVCTTVCAKMLAVDPCNENAHRMLMRCYARLGQPQLAQRQYQACIQVLNRQLGIPASSETTELYRRIVRRDPV
jgi:DNA-binding SARP family transcriptional activator